MLKGWKSLKYCLIVIIIIMDLMDRVLFALSVKKYCGSIEEFIKLTDNYSTINDVCANEWLRSNAEGLKNVMVEASKFLNEEYGINVKQESFIIDTREPTDNVACYDYSLSGVAAYEGLLKQYDEDHDLAVGHIVHELVHKYRRDMDKRVHFLFNDYYNSILNCFTRSRIGPYYYGDLDFDTQSFIRDFYNKENPFRDIDSWLRRRKPVKNNSGLYKFLCNMESAWLLRHYLIECPAINAGVNYYSLIKNVSIDEALKKFYDGHFYSKLITNFDQLLITQEPDLRYFKKLLIKGNELIKKEKKIE